MDEDYPADHRPQYLSEVRVTEDAYWDQQDRIWRDTKTRQKVPRPTNLDLRAATADDVLQRLVGLVPELTHILGALRDQTVNAFVNGLLDRVKTAMPEEITTAGQALIRIVVQQQAQETSHSSFRWTIESKVQELVTAHLRSLVAQELEKRLHEKPRLLEEVVTEALKSEALHTAANNLITPQLVKLVEGLRLELTAGASKSRY